MKKNLMISAALWSALVLSNLSALVSAQTRPRYNPRINGGACLTGTYRLNQSRSDDAYGVADSATRNMSGNRDQVRDNLVRRLEAPEVLSLDQRGRMVTMASTRGPEVTFEADGRTRNEQTAQGRNTSVRAWLSRNQLDVTTTGNRGSDYGVTFESVDSCRGLRVTRRLSNDRLGQPVIARSVYERTSDVAQSDVYAGGNTSPNYDNSRNDRRDDRRDERRDQRRNGSFIIPDGTQLNAVLENDLTTKNTRDGDRFTLTVRSPGAYNGAIIEGFVRDAQRSGRITGRAGINLEFDRIRLRDGRSGEFAGTVESVRTTDGSEVRVDQESGVREDDSQGTRTATRTGVGAALGAII
ncbi:MAG: hypothetical protein HOP19_12230, partial [Acidobacteria bacterium]|nr:hypothetical protein [Acidobacteriota bacterium]